ncbi:MAG: hypothetical protein WCK47_01220 [bacterium]|nr:hypothetical protein [Candidatus Sumerlaeota bacterium]
MIKIKKAVAVGVLSLAAASLCYGAQRLGKEMNLEQLTLNSDSIVIGTVKSKKVSVVDRHFETDYEIEVSEQLKGDGKGPGQKFVLTTPGGEITTPPLGMFVQLQTHMFAGEEVALFLNEKPRQISPEMAAQIRGDTKLLTTPRVVGSYEGKFSIITSPSDGRKKIMRYSLEKLGYVPNDKTMQRVLRAVASGDLPSTSAPVIDLGGGLFTTPQGKAMLDKAVSESGTGKIDRKASDEQIINSLKRSSAVNVQDLDEFRSQVQTFEKQQKSR